MIAFLSTEVSPPCWNPRQAKTLVASPPRLSRASSLRSSPAATLDSRGLGAALLLTWREAGPRALSVRDVQLAGGHDRLSVRVARFQRAR